tara:strand:+ start:388 stop:597 length:210 start_codon:yes stop_codon:yes gene_type:complete
MDYKDNTPIDMPEGKMEFSIRVLGNEFIGFKMIVDDFKMKWALVGVAGIGVLLWAVSSFGPAVASLTGG